MSEHAHYGQPDPRRLAETTAALTAALIPVRPLPSDRMMLSVALVFFIAFSLLATIPFGFFGFNGMTLVQKLIYLPAVLASAVALVLALLQSMVPGAKRRLGVGVAIGGSLVLLCLVVVALFPSFDLSLFTTHGMPCLRLGLMCAAASAALSYAFLRKGYPASPLRMSLAASSLCGLAGVSVLALHCPRFNAAHILVWHLGAIVLSATAGAALAYLRSDVALLEPKRNVRPGTSR